MKGLPVKLPEWRIQLVSELPAAIALFDPDLRYLAANAAWTARFDLTQGALLGRRHDELDASADEAFASVLQRALAGGTVGNYPGTQVGPGGQSSRLWLSARPHLG